MILLIMIISHDQRDDTNENLQGWSPDMLVGLLEALGLLLVSRFHVFVFFFIQGTQL